MEFMNWHLDSLILQTIALLFTAFLMPRFQIHGPFSGLIMVLALSFVNTHLWDAALFYSIPNSLTSQTILTLFVNSIVFWILAKSLPGIAIQGFLPAIASPILFTAVSLLTYKYGRDVDWANLLLQFQNSFRHVKELAKGGSY
jgi:uncharacterized membrane protein YvlD (DUF360 family)